MIINWTQEKLKQMQNRENSRKGKNYAYNGKKTEEQAIWIRLLEGQLLPFKCFKLQGLADNIPTSTLFAIPMIGLKYYFCNNVDRKRHKRKALCRIRIHVCRKLIRPNF